MAFGASLQSIKPGTWKTPQKNLSFGGGGGMGGGGMFGGSPMTGGYRPSGGGSSGGGVSVPSMPGAPSPATTQMNMPKAQAYQPFGGNPELEQDLGFMSEAGQGLMDPESDYYKRLSAEMQRQIGGQSQAQQRSAALRGAWGGLGGGQGGEVMQTQADIGQAGLEAQGQAEAGLALRAPQMGAGMMQSTFAPQMGLSQLGEGARQFGAGQAEGARQFGAGVGMQQQGMANQAAQFQQQMAMQQAQQRMDAERANQDAYLREMQLLYGGM